MNRVRTGTVPPADITIAVNGTTEPFWQAAREGRLVAPKCARCAAFRLPPTPFCPECQSAETDWVTLSGRGTVFSYSIVHNYPGHPGLVLAAAVLDLPDAPGARLVGNIVGVDPGDVHIDLEVEVFFGPTAGEWSVPLFRPIGPESAKK